MVFSAEGQDGVQEGGPQEGVEWQWRSEKFGTHLQGGALHGGALDENVTTVDRSKVPRPEAVGRAALGRLSREDDSNRVWSASKIGTGRRGLVGEVVCWQRTGKEAPHTAGTPHMLQLRGRMKDCDGSCGGTPWGQFGLGPATSTRLSVREHLPQHGERKGVLGINFRVASERDCDGSCGSTLCGQFCLSTSHINTHFSLRTPWRRR